MTRRLSENDYDLVYTHASRRAHIKRYTSAFLTECGIDLADKTYFGTGNQNEYDRARSLQPCKPCQRYYFTEDA